MCIQIPCCRHPKTVCSLCVPKAALLCRANEKRVYNNVYGIRYTRTYIVWHRLDDYMPTIYSIEMCPNEITNTNRETERVLLNFSRFTRSDHFLNGIFQGDEFHLTPTAAHLFCEPPSKNTHKCTIQNHQIAIGNDAHAVIGANNMNGFCLDQKLRSK